MKTIVIDGVEYNLTPKVLFKKGDWVVENGANGNPVQITSFEEDKGVGIKVWFSNGTGTYVDFLKYYHKFTIQDAKEGDLIYVSTEVKGIQAIFHKFKNGIIYFHCNLCSDFTQGGYMPIGSIELVCPLQETQHKNFFEKMHDAGYEWDAEKKELKKIKMLPTEWSEEDEQITLSIEQVMNCASLLNIVPEKIDKIRTWLKSLKDRYTWKPSSIQMECLYDAINHYHTNGYPASKLKELYEQMSNIYKL